MAPQLLPGRAVLNPDSSNISPLTYLPVLAGLVYPAALALCGFSLNNQLQQSQRNIKNQITLSEESVGKKIRKSEERLGRRIRKGEERVATYITESEKRLGARLEDIKESFRDVRRDIRGLKVDTQGLVQRQNELDGQDGIRLGDVFFDWTEKR